MRCFKIRETVVRSQMFFKLGVLKNFENFTEKTPVLDSLFDNLAGLKKSATLLKRDSNTGVFL